MIQSGSCVTVPVIRLIADDLTGALDSAAQFATAAAPLTVTWSAANATTTGSLLVDTGNRERVADVARQRFEPFIDTLAPAAGTLSFLKLDSLLRGHAGAEIAACARRWPGRPIIVAPAMPGQGRVTRGGRQFVVGGGTERVGEDIGATLARNAIGYECRAAGAAIPAGISLWDAETDDELRQIVSAADRLEGHPLWCGSAGLAAALATSSCQIAPRRQPPIAAPMLGIFGSDHPVQRRQLDEVDRHVIAVTDAAAATSRAVRARLEAENVALLTFGLPSPIERHDARRQIDAITRKLLGGLTRPATLVVSGGETLRSVCEALAADSLVVDGEIEPGVPCSRLSGGMWDGVRVVSKSGAFGRPDFLVALIALTKVQDWRAKA